MPRKPSAYMCFSQCNRDKIKKENPSLSFGQLGKLIDNNWKKLSPTEKEVYTKMSQNSTISL